MSLRVVLLCGKGDYQAELVRRAALRLDLVGVVWHSPPAPKGTWLQRVSRYRNPRALLRYLEVRACLPRYERAAEQLRQAKFPSPNSSRLGVAEINVADINSAEAVDFVRARLPDIVLVNGTNLLRRPVLALLPSIRLGIINLHTGLSPYSRGGNCNLFMVLEGHPELVGVTIHHINRGIDSGDIILSMQVPMFPDDNYEMLDIRTFDTGIDALLSAAQQLDEGRAARVPQWELGKLFLQRTGYSYEPYLRLKANRIVEDGLIRNYLAERHLRDACVRVIGEVS